MFSLNGKVNLQSPARMSPADQLAKLFRYDSGANRKIYASLSGHSGSHELSEEAKLFAHLASAQKTWYGRIKGENNNLDLWPQLEPAEARDLLDRLEGKWRSLIREQRGELDRVVSYRNSKGEPFETPLSDILHHLIIHGQHHRAQIAMKLREKQIEPPVTDFIFYVREANT